MVATHAERVATHAERVAANFGAGSFAYNVALYHDHIEDNLGEVPSSVLLAVSILTRRGNETYDAYIQRIKDSGSAVAIRVKRADLLDNIARCEGRYDGTVNAALKVRYERALAVLS